LDKCPFTIVPATKIVLFTPMLTKNGFISGGKTPIDKYL
jgi:hypothetical protein